MNNPLVLKTVSVIAFIISALFTIQLMTSGTVGFMAWVLTVGMAIILESCKVGFFYESLINTNIPQPVRIALGTISILLVFASIFASGSYVQNQANKTKNRMVKHSTEYKQLEGARTKTQAEYDSKKAEIESLKTEKETTVAEMKKIRDSYPSNYITVKENATKDINKKASDYDTKIQQKQNELKGFSDSLNKPMDASNLKVSADNGYTAMFTVITDMINSSAEYPEDKIKPESVEMVFFIALGIIFEIVAILTAFLAQLKSGTNPLVKSPPVSSNSSGIGFRPSTATEKQSYYDDEPQAKLQEPERKIGFYMPMAPTNSESKIEEVKSRGSLATHKVESNNEDSSHSLIGENPKTFATHNFHDIDNIVLGYYLDYVFDNVKPDKSIPGYQTTTKELNEKHNLSLGIDYIRKLKNHCEQLNILKSDSVSRKTYIVKQKHDIKV